MRGTRTILLLTIFGVLGVVGFTYYTQQGRLQKSVVKPPKPLPLALSASAEGWHYSQTESGRPVVEVFAKNFSQIKDPSKVDLEGVDLRIFDKNGTSFHQVKSAQAWFDTTSGVLYSEGEVDITLKVPAETGPSGKLLSIHSSGVTFDSKTGKAVTDRFAKFQFGGGEGQATGASYDPTIHELRLQHDVNLLWTGYHPGAPPMRVEAGELLYKEAESKVYLYQWSRLTRNQMKVEGGDAVVTLENGVMRRVDAQHAHGTDSYPGRNLEYQADQLTAALSDDGQIQKLDGEGSARLVSTSAASRTTVNADRVSLDFETIPGESVLKQALATGKSVVEVNPIEGKAPQKAETRILRSEVVLLKMRPGGKEIEIVETHTPGTLEFLPTAPNQPRRFMEAFRMWIHYAGENRVDYYKASQVTTRTDHPAPKKAGDPPSPPMKTSSKEMVAQFDPKTGDMSRMEQWDDFRYEEGDRRAQADRGVLDSSSNQILLAGKARAWDASGTLSANSIQMNRANGDTIADGKVVSSRLPDENPKKKEESSGVFSKKEPAQATANRMVSTNKNRKIHYTGDAVLWQGADRINADSIEIDRDTSTLTAEGQVRTLFKEAARKEEPKADEKVEDKAPSETFAGPPAPVFTTVRALKLVYQDVEGVAHYTGGVELNRGPLEVKGRELRAFFEKKDDQSDLDHAFADGDVKIRQELPGRLRTGNAEHTEYYVKDDKVVLYGGSPVMVDNIRGTTRGGRLTYYAKNDRLLVDGVESSPAVSRILRKNHR